MYNVALCISYRRANYFRGYKVSRTLKNFTLNKNFRGYGQPENYFTARIYHLHVAKSCVVDLRTRR